MSVSLMKPNFSSHFSGSPTSAETVAGASKETAHRVTMPATCARQREALSAIRGNGMRVLRQKIAQKKSPRSARRFVGNITQDWRFYVSPDHRGVAFGARY